MVFLILLSIVVGGAFPTAALAATFTVNSTEDRADATPGDGTCATAAPVACTLRAAVQEANAAAGADTIIVPAGTFTLSLVGGEDDTGLTGDLDLLAPVTITGNGASGPNATIVSGGGTSRVFDVLDTAGTTTISALTVTNGFSGVGLVAGGIWNSATLTLNGVRVVDSEGRLGGGGIQNDGTLTATDLTIDGCTTNSVGAGLNNAGVATLTGATLSGNTAGATGGGIQNDNDLTLTNVTVSGNTAGTDGGALYNNLTATLKNVTIAANTANRGANVFSPGDLVVTNTIVADGTGSANCNVSGSLTSGGSNLDTGTSCGFSGSGDLVGVSAGLGPLADYGGPTQTMALLPGSSALDAGQSCPPPATDQRGITRPQDGDGDTTAVCDIGAFEATGTAATTTSTTGSSTTTTTLPVCPAAPKPGCVAPTKAKLSIKEKKTGHERLSLGLKHLASIVPPSSFGNPASGTTSMSLCLYGDGPQLVGTLIVARAGESCGTPPKPCWKPIAGKGYSYADPDASASGVRKLIAKGGLAKGGSLTVQAGNNARKEQAAMPIGLAAALQGTAAVTVQVLTSDAACFGATLTKVSSASPTSFKASAPGAP